ncbi:hypothetical protein ScalyP_jg3310 [Parmales sp. scaly parma]|nr:hypothetical protein ScalyP_jg3310 [Parmales sp. scaly parma]|tara:strand:+ start:239 stop:727 length:489 start_codon:yes stop_codon:yes gene_type:complete
MLYQKLFCPVSHTAYKAISQSRYQVFATNHLIEKIGDITNLITSSPKQTILAGDTFVTLKWDGFAISSSDELYHASWENISGTTKFSLSPSIHSAQIHSIASLEQFHTLDDGDQIAEITCSATSLTHEILPNLLSEQQYIDNISSLHPTTDDSNRKFGEDLK